MNDQSAPKVLRLSDSCHAFNERHIQANFDRSFSQAEQISEERNLKSDTILWMYGFEQFADHPHLFHVQESYENRCRICGKNVQLIYNSKEKALVTVDEPDCAAEEFKWTVKFPSGKVIVCDWPILFRENYKKIRELYNDDSDINFILGSRERDTYHGSHRFSMMSTYVGNTCPSYVIGPNRDEITFGSFWDEDGVSETVETDGSVCTDLWNATMIDQEIHDAVIAHIGGRTTPGPGAYGLDKIIHIKPGIYEFENPHLWKSHTDPNYDRSNRMVYGKWIGPCK